MMPVGTPQYSKSMCTQFEEENCNKQKALGCVWKDSACTVQEYRNYFSESTFIDNPGSGISFGKPSSTEGGNINRTSMPVCPSDPMVCTLPSTLSTNEISSEMCKLQCNMTPGCNAVHMIDNTCKGYNSVPLSSSLTTPTPTNEIFVRSNYHHESCPLQCAPGNDGRNCSSQSECQDICNSTQDCVGYFKSSDGKYIYVTDGTSPNNYTYIHSQDLISSSLPKYTDFYRKMEIPDISMIEISSSKPISAAQTGWTLLQNMDCDKDATVLMQYKTEDVQVLQDLCDSMPDCAGFNSMGYLWAGDCNATNTNAASLYLKAGSTTCKAESTQSTLQPCVIGEPTDSMKSWCAGKTSDDCKSPCMWTENDKTCSVATCCNATLASLPQGYKGCDGISVCNQGVVDNKSFQDIIGACKTNHTISQANTCVARDTSNAQNMAMCTSISGGGGNWAPTMPPTLKKYADKFCSSRGEYSSCMQEMTCKYYDECVYLTENLIPSIDNATIPTTPGGAMCINMNISSDTGVNMVLLPSQEVEAVRACCRNCIGYNNPQTMPPNCLGYDGCSSLSNVDCVKNPGCKVDNKNTCVPICSTLQPSQACTTNQNKNTCEKTEGCTYQGENGCQPVTVQYEISPPGLNTNRTCKNFVNDVECPPGMYAALEPVLQDLPVPQAPGYKPCSELSQSMCKDADNLQGITSYCYWDNENQACTPLQQYTYDKVCVPRMCMEGKFLNSSGACQYMIDNMWATAEGDISFPCSSEENFPLRLVYPNAFNMKETPNAQGTSTWMGNTSGKITADEVELLTAFRPKNNPNELYYGGGSFDAESQAQNNTTTFVRNVAMRPCIDKNTYQVQDPECGSILFEEECTSNTSNACTWITDDRGMAMLNSAGTTCSLSQRQLTVKPEYCISQKCSPEYGSIRYTQSPYVLNDITMCKSEAGFNPGTGMCSQFCNPNSEYIGSSESENDNRVCRTLSTKSPKTYKAQDPLPCKSIDIKSICTQFTHGLCRWTPNENENENSEGSCTPINASEKYYMYNNTSTLWTRSPNSQSQPQIQSQSNLKSMNAMDRRLCPKLEHKGTCINGGNNSTGGCGMDFECQRSTGEALSDSPTYSCNACLPTGSFISTTTITPEEYNLCGNRPRDACTNAEYCASKEDNESCEGTGFCTWTDTHGGYCAVTTPCQSKNETDCPKTTGCTWDSSAGFGSDQQPAGLCVDSCVEARIPQSVANDTTGTYSFNTLSPEEAWRPNSTTPLITNKCYYDTDEKTYYAAPNPNYYCNKCASFDSESSCTSGAYQCTWNSDFHLCVPSGNSPTCTCVLDSAAKNSDLYKNGGAYGEGWNKLTQTCSGCPVPYECYNHTSSEKCLAERGTSNLYVLEDNESVCRWDLASRTCIPRPMYMNHEVTDSYPCFPLYNLSSCKFSEMSPGDVGQLQYPGNQGWQPANTIAPEALGCRPVRDCAALSQTQANGINGEALIERTGSTQTSNAICTTLAGDIAGENAAKAAESCGSNSQSGDCKAPCTWNTNKKACTMIQTLPPISNMVKNLVVLGVSIANDGIAKYLNDEKPTCTDPPSGSQADRQQECEKQHVVRPTIAPGVTVRPIRMCQFINNTCGPIPVNVTPPPFVGESVMNVEFEVRKKVCPEGQFMARRPLLCSDLQHQTLCAAGEYQRHYKVCNWNNNTCAPSVLNKQMARASMWDELVVEQPMCAPITNYCIRQAENATDPTAPPISAYNSRYNLLNLKTGYEYAVPMTSGNKTETMELTESMYNNHFFLKNCMHQEATENNQTSGNSYNNYNFKNTSLDLMDNLKCVGHAGTMPPDCIVPISSTSEPQLSVGDIVRQKYSYFDMSGKGQNPPSASYLCESNNNTSGTPDYTSCMHERPQDICKYRFTNAEDAQLACRYFNSNVIEDRHTRTISTPTAMYTPRHWAHNLHTGNPVKVCAGVMKLDESEYTPSNLPDPRACMPTGGVGNTVPTKAQLSFSQPPLGNISAILDKTGTHPFGNQTPPMGQSFAAVQGSGQTALATIKGDTTRSVFLLTADQTLNQPTPALDSGCTQWSSDDNKDDITGSCCSTSDMAWANVKSCATSNADTDAVNDLEADLIFWRIGASEYVDGGPVAFDINQKPSLDSGNLGEATSAFYTGTDVNATNTVPGAGYACLPTVGKPDMQGLYSWECTSNCADLWNNRPSNVASLRGIGTQSQASPDFKATDCNSDTASETGNTNKGYINRSSFLQSISDNMCHSMMINSEMEKPSYPNTSSGDDNEIGWPSLNVDSHTLHHLCKISDFNASTVDGEGMGECPEVVKSPGWMAMQLDAHGNNDDGTYSSNHVSMW